MFACVLPRPSINHVVLIHILSHACHTQADIQFVIIQCGDIQFVIVQFDIIQFVIVHFRVVRFVIIQCGIQFVTVHLDIIQYGITQYDITFCTRSACVRAYAWSQVQEQRDLYGGSSQR